MIDLRSIDLESLSDWRQTYRKQLGLPFIPDIHEALCSLGKAYLIEDIGQTLGYVVLSNESFLNIETPILSEIYLDVQQAKHARTILTQILEKLQPATIIGRTDDSISFPVLMDMQMPNSISTVLYELVQKPHWIEDKELSIKESNMEDINDLQLVYASELPEKGGIPDEMALTKSLAAWQHFCLIVNNTVVAVCYSVPQGKAYVSIVVIVLDMYKGNGYGRYLAAYVAGLEINAGNRIVAPIDPDDQAARGWMESLGAKIKGHFIYFRPHTGSLSCTGEHNGREAIDEAI